LSNGERVRISLNVVSSNFFDFCRGNREAYYYYEVLLRKGLLDSASNDVFIPAQSSSSNDVVTCSTTISKPSAGRSSSSGLDLDALKKRITADMNPDVDILRREREQRAATAEALADQEKFKLWQSYKKEKADLISQGEEVPDLLLTLIIEIEAELAMRLKEKKAALEAATNPASAKRKRKRKRH
jgi:hypothetical protein